MVFPIDVGRFAIGESAAFSQHSDSYTMDTSHFAWCANSELKCKVKQPYCIQFAVQLWHFAPRTLICSILTQRPSSLKVKMFISIFSSPCVILVNYAISITTTCDAPFGRFLLDGFPSGFRKTILRQPGIVFLQGKV